MVSPMIESSQGCRESGRGSPPGSAASGRKKVCLPQVRASRRLYDCTIPTISGEYQQHKDCIGNKLVISMYAPSEMAMA